MVRTNARYVVSSFMLCDLVLFILLRSQGFNTPPLGAFNAFKDTPSACGGVVHSVVVFPYNYRRSESVPQISDPILDKTAGNRLTGVFFSILH